MNRFSAVVIAAAALIFAVGCGGGGGVSVSRGDKLEVVEKLEREQFEVTYTNSETQRGDVFDILPGTVFEVVSRPTEVGRIMEVVPVKWVTADGDIIEDATEIIRTIMPERYWNLTSFNPDTGLTEVQAELREYSFSLSIDYLGSKVKRVE